MTFAPNASSRLLSREDCPLETDTSSEPVVSRLLLLLRPRILSRNLRMRDFAVGAWVMITCSLLASLPAEPASVCACTDEETRQSASTTEPAKAGRLGALQLI